MSSFDARLDGDDVLVTLRLDATSVVDLVGRAGEGVVAKAMAATSHPRTVVAYLDARFEVGGDGRRCPRTGRTRVVFDAATDKHVVDVRYRCRAGLRQL